MNSLSHNIRVFHNVMSLDHGGLERLVVDWVNARNERYPGSTEIICLDGLGELASLTRAGHVACLNANRSRSPWDMPAVHRLRARISSPATRHPSPVTVLQAHNLAAWQYAVLACIGTGRRVVYTQHGANVHNCGWKNRWRSRILAMFTDRIVAVSGSVAASMVKEQGIPLSRITVIPNGIAPIPRPTVAETLQMRNDMGIPPDAMVIGTVGRLAHVKGQDRLLSAFSALCRYTEGGMLRTSRGTNVVPSERSSAFSFQLSSLFLLLVGDGPERAALEQQARDLGIADRVTFAGFRGDARELVSVMDLFALPSRSEGLPVALLEAMAAGVPVMATNAGESWGVIQNGLCGVKLPDEEGLWPGLMEDQLDQIGARLSDLAEKTERARQRVAEHYSLMATLDAYEAIYRAM